LHSNKTIAIAGPQHFCGTNGITCSEPALNWEEYTKGYQRAVAHHAPILPYIGHDEPMIQFYSSRAGSANNITYRLTLPKDPPTLPEQDGSGGTFNFQLHPAFWFSMQLCDDQGSPNPGGIPGHPNIPCKPDSDSNLFASNDPSSPKYFGLGPGQGFMEMQFYPPGWVNQPAGVGCTARQWCAALNIDTFQDNENTNQFNNDTCLGTVGPEPVNFAFLTTNGVATAPAGPVSGQGINRIPDPRRDLLMNAGDTLRLHMFDTSSGFRVTVDDLTSGKSGSMTASAANGFGSVLWDPDGTTCTELRHNYHPMYNTATPETRNFNAAHTGNIGFSDEIGHFEYCAKIRTDTFATCDEPLGSDTNNPDNAGPDPDGDDDFCLSSSQSTRVLINGCLDIDGDFDGVSYKHTWPGSISNPTADRLLNPQPIRFTSPLTRGFNFDRMAFESNISRDESDDTSFRVDNPCQRHVQNPADPDPHTGCVNPPPNSEFYPFYSTTQSAGTCWWQFGGRFIPGTDKQFGGSAGAEFGSLRDIQYPAAPFGTITIRSNDFRSARMANPCPTTSG
jgi:hypothetical protein